MAGAGESLKYKTWVLKVSIHCEGCKKKVEKILHGVEDVYSVAVDSKQNKVTVTGNVDADVLIKRLLKYGKHAELLPCKVPSKNDDKRQQPPPPPLPLPPKIQQATPHEKKSDSSSLAKEMGTSGSPSSPQKKKPPDAKKEEAPSQTKNSLEGNASGNNGTTTKKASTRPENTSAGPSDVKSAAAAASVAAGDTSRGNKQPAEGPAGDDSRKNNNKEVPVKGVPNRPCAEEAPKAAKFAGCNGGAVASPASSNYYPAHLQAHQPIYTSSHRTAQPSSSYPVNYSPPASYTYAHVYAHPEGTASPPPGNFSGDGTSAFDLFSDENTNSCSLM